MTTEDDGPAGDTTVPVKSPATLAEVTAMSDMFLTLMNAIAGANSEDAASTGDPPRPTRLKTIYVKEPTGYAAMDAGHRAESHIGANHRVARRLANSAHAPVQEPSGRIAMDDGGNGDLRVSDDPAEHCSVKWEERVPFRAVVNTTATANGHLKELEKNISK
ncbi:hypothetical protein HK101_007588 [Irineochytrium annulatum]|nr:hypothetical protein HK101_007588 [Irineochytrium annulatum]